MFRKKELHNDLKRISRIAVASGTNACGVSFVSELLAFGLECRGSVSLTELGTPHFYSAFGFESRFLAKGYIDFLSKIKAGDHIDYKASEKNIYEKISWICQSDFSELKTAEIFRAFYMPCEEYCIFDCSGLDVEDKLQLMAAADYRVIVIDPLPSKLSASMKFLEQIRFKYPDAFLVVNKMNPGVHTAELSRFLGTKDYFSLPSVPYDYIYKSEYNSMSVFKLGQGIDSLKKTQDMLCRVFP